MARKLVERGNEPIRERNTGRTSGLHRQLPNSRFDWRDIPAVEIGTMVQFITSSGEAVILGCTSDGGAVSITILSGDDRIRQFPASVQAWDVFRDWVTDSYQDSIADGSGK